MQESKSFPFYKYPLISLQCTISCKNPKAILETVLSILSYLEIKRLFDSRELSKIILMNEDKNCKNLFR